MDTEKIVPNEYKRYKIFGLTVASEFEIPLADETEDEKIDVTVSMGNPGISLGDSQEEEQYSFADQDMWFYFKGDILFRIQNGNSIVIWKENPNYPDDMVLTYLLGNAFAFLLMERYLVPVHGSALNGDQGAFIISGRSGGGKSTIAKELLKRGFQFITDDIAAVEPKGDCNLIYPGPPWTKVCRNELGPEEDAGEYTFLVEDSGKYARRLRDGYVRDEKTLAAIFILLADNVDNVEIREIQGIDKLHHLTHNLFRGSIYHEMGLNPRRMQLFLDVASRTKIFFIKRPIIGNTVEEVTDLIEKTYNSL